MDKQQQSNLIGKTILKTSMWFVGAVAFIMFVISNVFPLSYAKLCLNFGLDNKAAYYYERNYQINPDINSLYLATSAYVDVRNSEKVVYYVNLLQGHNKYSILVANVDEMNGEWSNENDRLTAERIIALLTLNRKADAIEYVKQRMEKGIEFPKMNLVLAWAKNQSELDAEVSTYEQLFN